MLLPVYIPLISDIINGFLAKLPLIKHLTVAQFIVARPIFPVEKNYNPSVSVVVPARNESGNIEAAITRTPDMGEWTEIIFVEGGSSDDTWEEIKRVKEKYPEKKIKITRQDGKGKGDAVRKGFQLAEGEILMILDADLTMPPEELPKFYKAIVENKGEFINGVRLVYPMEDQAMRLLNLYGNKFFSLIFTYILGQNYKDTLCGTKVLRKSDYEKLAANRNYFGDFDPYGDFDLIFGAAKLCLKTVQLPIKYKSRTYGETNISRFSGGWLLLKMSWLGFLKFKWRLR
jgi:glycosyltransferase involved in cell wall biosynthesis